MPAFARSLAFLWPMVPYTLLAVHSTPKSKLTPFKLPDGLAPSCRTSPCLRRTEPISRDGRVARPSSAWAGISGGGHTRTVGRLRARALFRAVTCTLDLPETNSAVGREETVGRPVLGLCAETRLDLQLHCPERKHKVPRLRRFVRSSRTGFARDDSCGRTTAIAERLELLHVGAHGDVLILFPVEEQRRARAQLARFFDIHGFHRLFSQLHLPHRDRSIGKIDDHEF
jgi:hypothetical protein